jgi:organic radical activating enzyme
VNKYFPILSDTACKLKWGWSTVYLNTGLTASCHRASFSTIPDNFDNFHTTAEKTSARETMLKGQWPTGGCEYCQGVESANGFSDRMLHNSIPGLVSDGTYPTILETYFSNTCNLACLYCNPGLSSSIDAEHIRFGDFAVGGVELLSLKQKPLTELEAKFWHWMKNNFEKLERFHFLGGEPFYQQQLDLLIDFVDQHPNPQLELNLITNLMVDQRILDKKISQLKRLIAEKKLKRLDITASIDCWGAEQEYVRYGLKLDQWLSNFLFLLDQRWIKLNINQTISALTIKTMPRLLQQLAGWRKIRPVGQYFSVTEPGPSYLRPNIFGRGVFDKDFAIVLNLMTGTSGDETTAYKYMQGIANEIETHNMNTAEVNKLFVFLNEKDRRRNTNWRTTFPWLEKYVL